MNTAKNKEPWRDAWEEEKLNNEEAFQETMNDYYEREAELYKARAYDRRIITDFADAWKRGKH